MMARILQRHKDSQVSNVDIDTVDRGTEKAPTLQEMGREHEMILEQNGGRSEIRSDMGH
jgi:hypothetical protein